MAAPVGDSLQMSLRVGPEWLVKQRRPPAFGPFPVGPGPDCTRRRQSTATASPRHRTSTTLQRSIPFGAQLTSEASFGALLVGPGSGCTLGKQPPILLPTATDKQTQHHLARKRGSASTPQSTRHVIFFRCSRLKLRSKSRLALAAHRPQKTWRFIKPDKVPGEGSSTLHVIPSLIGNEVNDPRRLVPHQAMLTV